ncbi:hypothetical protein FEM48_Zijuj02G0175900 [Ziziphus jujuba var. spinosa]|uniref:Cupin type-1 domain-containing protein n=1 Tax=Ziziphus jujuba var. spinosa TaxID=714518 RepID=A0A978VX14_ZIZJJ|nr:hypothetical protein FEM48_Zijuj02G0175900 [Ziziphus jujuba var. spinosa]
MDGNQVKGNLKASLVGMDDRSSRIILEMYQWSSRAHMCPCCFMCALKNLSNSDFEFSLVGTERTILSPFTISMTMFVNGKFCKDPKDVNADHFFTFGFDKGDYNAVAFTSLSSQNPGVITSANTVFRSDPPINPNVLTKAIQVDKNIIDYLQKQFWVDNN